jgi:hypothetical protein
MTEEPTEEPGGWIAVSTWLISSMSNAQESVIRSMAEKMDMSDLRTFRAYLTEHEWTYYDVLRWYYGD